MKLTSLAFAFLLLTGSAFAFEMEATEEIITEEMELTINHGEFLGCVSSRHECRHEAEHHGYHHSVAVRDPYTCHHDHHAQIACYGE